MPIISRRHCGRPEPLATIRDAASLKIVKHLETGEECSEAAT
jgi:hypothetical protein